jgi:colanic acid/amylovoran biosynthesis protein
MYTEEGDSHFIQSIVEGYDIVGPNLVDSPSTLISQLHKCRIAVVGSYHAAVFSLAQGVPVIGLYNADYYHDKFLGLEALYEAGVFPVDLADPKWTQTFSGLLRHVWDSAPRLRPGLIASADKQIDLGWQGYERVRKLVEQHCAGV